MKDHPTSKFVKAKVASAYVGLPYHTFRHAVLRGLIPHYRFGGNRMFKLSELDTALEAFRVSSTAEVLS